MRRSVSRRAVAGTLAAICVVSGLTVHIHAQEEVYKKGLEAWKDGKWAEAAKAMQTAIAAERSESTTRKVRIGGVGIGGIGVGGTEYPYLPHYFLGDALMNQKNCAGAIVAWAES